jgi:2-(1,2-epoxy-1,2-dihydrophenyl)acetyl-CoA isomerase
MTYETLIHDVSGGVATLTLNRPESANALNLQMARDLFDASRAIEAEPSVRAVVLTGAGRMFCAGGDLKSFSEQGDDLPAHL